MYSSINIMLQKTLAISVGSQETVSLQFKVNHNKQ